MSDNLTCTGRQIVYHNQTGFGIVHPLEKVERGGGSCPAEERWQLEILGVGSCEVPGGREVLMAPRGSWTASERMPA